MILHLGLPYWWSNIGGRPLDNDMMEIHKAYQVQPDMDSLGLERPEHRPPNWRPCFSGMVGLYNVIYFRSVRSHRSIGWRCENLVGGLEHIILFHVLGIIIPTDLHIFQRGGHTVRGKKQKGLCDGIPISVSTGYKKLGRCQAWHDLCPRRPSPSLPPMPGMAGGINNHATHLLGRPSHVGSPQATSLPVSLAYAATPGLAHPSWWPCSHLWTSIAYPWPTVRCQTTRQAKTDPVNREYQRRHCLQAAHPWLGTPATMHAPWGL